MLADLGRSRTSQVHQKVTLLNSPFGKRIGPDYSFQTRANRSGVGAAHGIFLSVHQAHDDRGGTDLGSRRRERSGFVCYSQSRRTLFRCRIQTDQPVGRSALRQSLAGWLRVRQDGE